ncbi:MAG TPA: hypothetical protein VH561_05335 [Micromonosporaceae bacterium]
MKRWLRRPLVVLAAVTVSCFAGSGLVHSGEEQNLRAIGEVTALSDINQTGQVLVRVERDGHTTWWSVDDTTEATWLTDPIETVPSSQDCAGQICYRVAGDALRVDVSQDGGATYTVAWQIDGDAYNLLAHTYPDLGDAAQHLSSRSVVVHATANGYVVFVANGRDGLLFRDEG